MPKRFAIVLLILILVALLAGLRWRQIAGERTAGSGSGGGEGVSAGGTRESASPGGLPGEHALPPPGDAPKLHGLRRLSTEVAAARGWKPPAPAEVNPLREARKLWGRTSVDLRFDDEPLENILKFLADTYGLHVRIDSAVSLEGKKVSFAVKGLHGDRTVELLTRSSNLGFAIDAAGVAWITTPERAKTLAAPPEPQTDPWSGAASWIRWSQSEKPKTPKPVSEPFWKGQKVTVSIVRKPIREAMKDLGTAMGMSDAVTIGGWTYEALKKADAALPVSVVGEDMPVDKAIEEILRDSGIVVSIREGHSALFQTTEQVEAERQGAEATRKALAEDASEESAFRSRRVSIRGDILTASEVAGQVSAQTGVTLRISADVADCPVVWESDGLEQGVGEVLDILARDGDLLWRWQGDVEPSSFRPFGARCLWVVGARER